MADDVYSNPEEIYSKPTDGGVLDGGFSAVLGSLPEEGK